MATSRLSQVSDFAVLLQNYKSEEKGTGTTTFTTSCFKKGDLIYLGGSCPQKLFLIKRGFVRLGYYTENGREVTSAFLKPGDLFGSYFPEEAATDEFALTLTEADVQVITKWQFEQLLQKQPAFDWLLMRIMVERYQGLARKFVDLAFKEVKERLISFLGVLAEAVGYPKNGVVVIDNFLTHQDFACILNTCRQQITTYLIQLEAEGYICYSRKKIEIRENLLRKITQCPVSDKAGQPGRLT